MQRFPINLIDGEFHIGGFPDAVKVIAVSPLAGDLSRQCADMVLHHSDLKFAQDCLVTLSSTQAMKPVTVEALWRSAVIHYCKCFGTQGKTRARLRYEEIFPSGLPQEVHRHFMLLRNKHVAHDENLWTQATPMAVLAAAGKTPKIEEVVCTNITAITCEPIGISNLSSLLVDALAWVESRIDKLCEQMKLELEKHPYEELLAQPEPEPYYAAKAEDISKPRRQ